MKKGRVLVWFGNTITALAIMALGWLAWTQEFESIWHQYQDRAAFEATPTMIVTSTPSPTAITPEVITSTPSPTATAIQIQIPTIMPTQTPSPAPTPLVKTNYLLEVPAIKLSWVVHHITLSEVTDDPWGIKKSILDAYGVVDYPHLQYPGEAGLVAIAGHSDISGNPFWSLGKIKPDDQIFLTLKDGTKFIYTVYKTVIVDPEDQVFWNTEYANEIRLVSCLIGSTKKRIMIFAFQYQPKP